MDFLTRLTDKPLRNWDQKDLEPSENVVKLNEHTRILAITDTLSSPEARTLPAHGPDPNMARYHVLASLCQTPKGAERPFARVMDLSLTKQGLNTIAIQLPGLDIYESVPPPTSVLHNVGWRLQTLPHRSHYQRNTFHGGSEAVVSLTKALTLWYRFPISTHTRTHLNLVMCSDPPSLLSLLEEAPWVEVLLSHSPQTVRVTPFLVYGCITMAPSIALHGVFYRQEDTDTSINIFNSLLSVQQATFMLSEDQALFKSCMKSNMHYLKKAARHIIWHSGGVQERLEKLCSDVHNL